MAEKNKDDKAEELEIVGPGAVEDEGEEPSPADIAKAKGESALSVEDDEDEEKGEEGEEGEEEQSLGHSEDDEEEPPKQKRSRRQREKDSRARDKRELAFLRIRNDQLEQRFGEVESRQVQSEKMAIDQRIETLKGQLNLADEVIAEAVTKGQGKDHKEAMKIRERITENLRRLEEAKENMETTEPTAEERRAAQQPQVPMEVRVNAGVWRKQNPWWKPNGQDKDSAEVRKIDNSLVQEGYDPCNEEYWEELTSRVKDALPHRFEEADEGEEPPLRRNGKVQKKNGGGPRFSTSGREVNLKPNQVHISAARKAAMVEAGVWDDAVLRQRFLKQYQKYDRENAGRNS
jgi:hypothetical protein